ncbi:MAG TPA: L,D-transpeptidase family protein [Acidimicrobiia bacterium]|nr:L,D-transpeptidase family protein [Acidimicrobiia bacterium]
MKHSRLDLGSPVAKLWVAGFAVALVAVGGAVLWRSDTHPSPAPSARSVAIDAAATPAPVTPTLSPSPSPSPTKPAAPQGTPDPNPHLGTSGPAVLAIQQKLASLTYMVGTVDGQFGAGTRDGLIAFQKVEGLPRTGEGDPATLAKLQTATTPTPAYATPADHIELDIAHQVVYVVRGGAVTAILPTSTGSGQSFTSQGWTRKAITQNGAFSIYWKVNGWHQAPLGDLYKPSFFNDGEAFHGYPEVPTYPASHGCARLPMEFADWFFANAAPYGETVYVYGGPSGPNPDPVVQTSTATSAPPDLSTPTPSPSPSPSPSPTPPSLLGGLFPPPSPSPSPSPLPLPSPSPSVLPSPSPEPTPTPSPSAS